MGDSSTELVLEMDIQVGCGLVLFWIKHRQIGNTVVMYDSSGSVFVGIG